MTAAVDAPAELLCDLCQLDCGPAPYERKVGTEDHHFCCLGCMNVYSILAESGVIASGQDFRESDVYRQSLKLGLISTRAQASRVIPADAPSVEAVLQVSGMWCASCGWLIEHALAKETGVVSVEVLFASDLVRVKYCPRYLPPTRITEAISALGYRAANYEPNRPQDSAETRDSLLRIGIAGFLWMNVMLFSLPIYASYWEPIGETARRLVPFILLLLATPAVFYSAWPVHKMAWAGLKHGFLRMEALLSLGILAAYGYSTAQAILGGQHYYFDTACAIVTLVLLGKLLEKGAKARTAQSIALLYGLMPKKARILQGASERFVSVDALQPGMIFLVKAGERIPADGVITSGSALVDESVLTGESAPRAKQAGDEVICGSLSTNSVLEVRASRAAGDSTLSHIIRSVEAAISHRSNLERIVDKVSRTFVPVVILASLATVAAGLALFYLAPAEAILRGIAVLVIACPCALGVATPLAVTAAIGNASRRGILISGAEVLETVTRVDLVVLDKTGTVTEGKFRLLHVDENALPDLAAVERYSEHPLAAPIVARAAELHPTLPAATQVQIFKGQGISGIVDGRRVVIGTRRLVEPPAEVLAEAAPYESEAATVTYWNVEDRFGYIALGDTIKPEASQLLAALRARNIRTALVSGDTEAATAAIARKIGADEYRAETLPAQKAEIVRAFQAAGQTVAVVGDGVNDAPALAAANLGIALGAGADLAMHAAPVVLVNSALSAIPETFELARKAHRVISQNLFWAFAYNTAGISLAVAGILNPILAACAMVLSSLSVIANSRRLSR